MDNSFCDSMTLMWQGQRKNTPQSIEFDLAWLGISPDRVVRQSQRFALYQAAAEKLRAAGRLYPAYETAEELERRRKRQQARGLPPIYDRAALELTAAERARLEAEGRRPHWRFKLDHTVIRWDDLVRGESHIDSASLSDPVLLREDGTYLYTLPSVVDDIDLKVTHIIRGEDHVTNTAVQIQLFEALAGQGAAPLFGHHNLLTAASGEGLSKRSGALSIAALARRGNRAAGGRRLRRADRNLRTRFIPFTPSTSLPHRSICRMSHALRRVSTWRNSKAFPRARCTI